MGLIDFLNTGWHPGDRVHQRIGRAIAGLVLHGIRDALLLWKKSDNLVLRDEDWHGKLGYHVKYYFLHKLNSNIFCPIQ